MEKLFSEIVGLKAWLTGGAIATIAGVGGFIQKVRAHGGRIKASEKAILKLNEKLNDGLYDVENQPIYMPVRYCKECRVECYEHRTKENENRTKEHAEVTRLLRLLLKKQINAGG